MSNPDRPDSVVLETITGRGSVYSVIHHKENIQRIDGVLAEVEQNWGAVKAIYERIDWNKKRRLSSLRVSWGTISTSLGHSALDLLLSERYIEEKSEFYSRGHTMVFLINSINERLSNWTTNKDASKWFTENEFILKQLFETFYADLKKVRQELLSKC